MADKKQNTTDNINVFIDGDKNGFNSKSSIQRFKQSVKNELNFNLSNLAKHYLKPNYVFELVSQTNKELKFIIKLQDETNKENSRKVLLSKLEMLRKQRNNLSFGKIDSSVDVPKDIADEYKKLMKISKVPIPSPSDIISNPDQYKQMISMIISNPMMKKIGSSHPYSKYFKLLANKLNVTEMNLPKNNSENVNPDIEKLMKMSETVENVKGNEIKKDDDTDTEEEETIDV